MLRIRKNLSRIAAATMILLAANVVSAQDLKNAIRLTESEQFESAETEFKALLQKDAKNGDVYYYYGESFLKRYFTDIATTQFSEVSVPAEQQFKAGIQADPLNPLNYVGLGKIELLKKNYPSAKADFDKAISLLPSKANKGSLIPVDKQAQTYMRIAESYVRGESVLDTAIVFKYLNKATELDKKNPELFIITGDAYLYLLNDGSKAILNYKNSQALDPKSPKAKLRLGQLWVRAKNYNDALVYYKEAIQIDSSFAPAFRELAELYAMAGKYEFAKTNYQKFLALSSNNISARVRYISFLFLTKDYAECIKEAEAVIKIDQTYNVVNRLLAYSYYELGVSTKDASNFPKGIIYIDTYLKNAPEEKQLPSDYVYSGRLYMRAAKDSLANLNAIEKLKVAILKDPNNVDLYNDIASIYGKLKRYSDATVMLEKKIALGKGITNDYYTLGKYYYNMQAWGKADTAFIYVNTEKADFIPGWYWRALVNVNMDPETKDGKAKPIWETLITKASPDSMKYVKELTAAYEYLGYYFYINRSYCDSKANWQHALNLDAKNEKALSVMSELRTRCPN
ncbi:MAG: tetratricopeptide repeat protein [Bacteroidota bacterium]